MEPIRVLIVDDHPMIRRGLRSLLTSFNDIQVIGEAEDAATALQALTELSPEVVLLDIQMVGPDGIAAATLLLKAAPNIKIIVLTAHQNEEYLSGALRAGAHAYLLKNSTGETIVDAIRQVYQGRRVLSPALIDSVLRQFQSIAQSQAKDEYGLTDEERKALTLIAKGASNEQVAQEMYWGERTMRRKMEEIMTKMGTKSRAHTVAEAIKKGLI